MDSVMLVLIEDGVQGVEIDELRYSVKDMAVGDLTKQRSGCRRRKRNKSGGGHWWN